MLVSIIVMSTRTIYIYIYMHIFIIIIVDIYIYIEREIHVRTYTHVLCFDIRGQDAGARRADEDAQAAREAARAGEAGLR